MKPKASRLLLFLFILQSASPALGAPADAAPTENLISGEYGTLLLDDTKHVLSAPARWDGRDWLLVGLGTGAVVATAAWVDEPLQEEMQRHRNRSNNRVARTFGPFGYEYAPLVLGAFEASGYLYQDDRALQVAHDGVAASLLATGLVTGSLKLAFGRTRPFDRGGVHDFSPFSGNDSFPSGHSTEAFALATVISEHYDAFWVKAVSYGTATMVGYSRMESDSHWASDVLAGALIGIVVGKTVVGFNKERRYELSPVVDGGMTGVKATRRF
jgi:membrane-associated phospholipid phosphatase